MRLLVSALAMSAGLLLATASTHAHTQPHVPKDVRVLLHLATANAYHEVSALPVLPVAPPVLVLVVPAVLPPVEDTLASNYTSASPVRYLPADAKLPATPPPQR